MDDKIITAVIAVALGFITALGTTTRIFFGFKAEIFKDMETRMDLRLAQQELKCTNALHDKLEAIKDDIAEIKTAVNGGSK